MKFMFLDTFGIGHAIWKLLYDIFVKGPLYIVHGLGDAITYLSGQKIVDKIFGSNGHFFNMPPQFLIFLVIAIVLIILFAGGVILHAMVHQNIASTISSLANRTLMVILLMILIPLFFWIINFTVIAIIHIIMPQFLDGRTLSDKVGALGFTDGQNHQDWHYDSGYPDWNNYNLFLGTFGSFFCMVIFFYLGLSLIQRIFDLFLLYITSPIVFATATSGAQWQKVNLWKDLVIGRFISTLGVILSLTLFLNLEPLMINIASDVSDSWMGQVAFKLLFITGGAIATLNAQILFSSLVGPTVGIMEGMRMLSTMKAASSGAKAGTLGMLGVGKGLLMGKRKIVGSKSNDNNGIVSALKSGGIARTTSFTTKATVGSALATAGFIGGAIATYKTVGVRETVKRARKQIITPVTSIGNVIKNKTTNSFNTGMNKHVSSKTNASKYGKQEIKKNIKKTNQQNKTLLKQIKKGEK